MQLAYDPNPIRPERHTHAGTGSFPHHDKPQNQAVGGPARRISGYRDEGMGLASIAAA